MAVTLTLVGKTPGNTQFGLDTFTERYKCDATADVVLTDTGVPALGSAHPDYAFMFATARYCAETSESASALDLVYTGCLGSLDDAPVLPSQEHDDDNAVMSASSSRSSSGIVMSSPLTVQYYSPNSVVNYISFGARGASNAPTPSEDIQVITLTIGDTSISAGGTVDAIVSAFFTVQIISTIQSKEIVAGQFWSNIARTSKILSPYIFSLPSGPYLVLVAPGSAYVVGDSLTIAGGGGTAVIELTQVISGGVSGWNITSITCTTPDTNVAATGGSGTGAIFDIVIP